MVQSVAFRVIAIAVPSLALLIGVPLALTPFAGDPRGPFGPYILTAAPFYAAVLASPGYLACLVNPSGAKASSPIRRWWIRASLVLAALASAAGILGASVMLLFGPPAVVTFGCVVYLWVRFERDARTR